MKKLFVLLMALFTLAQVDAQEKNVIRIATDNTDLILQVAPNGRLYQAYLGDKLLNEKDINNFSPYVKGGSDGSVSTRGWEVYPGSGAEDYFEPAVAITHNDGNPSTILRYVSSEQKAVAGGTETVIQLKDDQYPVEVTLHGLLSQGELPSVGNLGGFDAIVEAAPALGASPFAGEILSAVLRDASDASMKDVRPWKDLIDRLVRAAISDVV